ncbi:MAG: exodeoxyribonuclease VII large subunit [Ignavibacteria bacterium]
MLNYHSGKDFFSLSEFCQFINEAMISKFGRTSYWIEAEIASINNRGGHCYLTLIEKDPGTTGPKAEIKGMIWSNKFIMLNKKFNDATELNLQASIKILFSATIDYHRTYGLSLNITDLKPEFTLGSLLQERNSIIKKLTDDGDYFLNKKKAFPLVPQRIAVISARDSKGFEDFETKILNNVHNYKYFIKLFPAPLQGEKAAVEIKNRLLEIFSQIDLFDIAVIVRGGGGLVNLNCFNNYNLSRTVARFPIPVITGIGHTSNISVVDEVAHLNKITPTDVADFIVGQTYNFEKSIQKKFKDITTAYDKVKNKKANMNDVSCRQLFHFLKIRKIEKQNYLSDLKAKIIRETNLVLKQKKEIIIQKKSGLNKTTDLQLNNKFSELEIHADKTRSYFNFRISNATTILSTAFISLNQTYQNFMKKERLILKNKSEKVSFLDPVNILKRGYSITLKNGKAITNIESLDKNDIIKTILFEAEIESKITNLKKLI